MLDFIRYNYKVLTVVLAWIAVISALVSGLSIGWNLGKAFYRGEGSEIVCLIFIGLPISAIIASISLFVFGTAAKLINIDENLEALLKISQQQQTLVDKNSESSKKQVEKNEPSSGDLALLKDLALKISQQQQTLADKNPEPSKKQVEKNEPSSGDLLGF
jgi:Sec-independent protein translocase protein TatA